MPPGHCRAADRFGADEKAVADAVADVLKN